MKKKFFFIIAAAYGLLKKRARLFSMGSSNAVLEFFLEGIPSLVETHLNSKKVRDVLNTGRVVCK